MGLLLASVTLLLGLVTCFGPGGAGCNLAAGWTLSFSRVHLVRGLPTNISKNRNKMQCNPGVYTILPSSSSLP